MSVPAVRVIVAKVWRLVWKVTSLLIPARFAMVFFVAHYPMLILYKLIRSANVHSIRHQWDDYTILLIIIFSLCFLLVPHVEKVPWLSGRFKRRAAIRYQQSQTIQPYDEREGSYGHKG